MSLSSLTIFYKTPCEPATFGQPLAVLLKIVVRRIRQRSSRKHKTGLVRQSRPILLGCTELALSHNPLVRDFI